MDEKERKEMRERHRREREQMNLPRYQEPEPANLFSGPIRVRHFFFSLPWNLFWTTQKSVFFHQYLSKTAIHRKPSIQIIAENESRPKNHIDIRWFQHCDHFNRSRCHALIVWRQFVTDCSIRNTTAAFSTATETSDIRSHRKRLFG